MPVATLLGASPLPWAQRWGFIHAGDFTRDIARWNGGHASGHGNVPGFSMTRASTGYAQTMDGLLVPFASGAMRRTDRGLLVESARTNLLLRSDDWTNASWTKSNITATLDQTGPDAVATSATRLTATAGNGTVLQSITSASANRYGSVWIKRITGSGNIDVTLDGGTAWTTIGVTTLWQRLGKAQVTVTNPNFGLRIVTNGDEVAVKFGMVESADYPSSPIPTAGATATRAADVALITGLSLAYPLTLYFQVDDDGTLTASNVYGGLSDGTFNESTYVAKASGNVNASSVSGGAGQLTGTSRALVTGVSAFAWREQTNNVGYSYRGQTAQLDTSCTMPVTSTQIAFGGASWTGGGQQCFAYVRRWGVAMRPLGDGELQALTQ